MIRLTQKVDIVGLFSSGLCALHCMALPLMISYGFFEGLQSSSIHHFMELLIVFASVIMVATSVYQGWKIHRVWIPYTLFAFGLVILFIGLSLTNHWLMALGGFCVGFGHLVNYKLIHRYSLQ